MVPLELLAMGVETTDRTELCVLPGDNLCLVVLLELQVPQETVEKDRSFTIRQLLLDGFYRFDRFCHRVNGFE